MSFVAIASIGSPLVAQKTDLDRDLAVLVHKMVVDSVNGGGRHPSQVFVAADSVSASIMGVAEVPVDSAMDLTCPGSTNATGGVPSGPLGYLVRVRVNGEGDTREVSVNKACRFIYCGRTSGFSTANAFYEMVDFEVKREGSRWRVTRRLSWAIT